MRRGWGHASTKLSGPDRQDNSPEHSGTSEPHAAQARNGIPCCGPAASPLYCCGWGRTWAAPANMKHVEVGRGAYVCGATLFTKRRIYSSGQPNAAERRENKRASRSTGGGLHTIRRLSLACRLRRLMILPKYAGSTAKALACTRMSWMLGFSICAAGAVKSCSASLVQAREYRLVQSRNSSIHQASREQRILLYARTCSGRLSR